jgi:ribonucleoside-diphosphate reductase alpha chain
VGEQLSPLDCHDILCHIANLSFIRGIRRSAMISLFSFDDDEEMVTCKYGAWWELNEQEVVQTILLFLKEYKITEKKEF